MAILGYFDAYAIQITAIAIAWIYVTVFFYDEKNILKNKNVSKKYFLYCRS